MDFVAFFDKEVSEVATVLSCDAGDEGFFHEMGIILTRPSRPHVTCPLAN